MDKISIDLLTSKAINNDHNVTSLSVFSLSKNKENENYVTQIDNLINTRKQKRKKLLSEYNKLFSRCVERIQIADTLNQTEICFQIPSAIINCNDYNSTECLEFIENKLRDLDIDTLKVTSNSIFITWIYIELNKEMKDKKLAAS